MNLADASSAIHNNSHDVQQALALIKTALATSNDPQQLAQFINVSADDIIQLLLANSLDEHILADSCAILSILLANHPIQSILISFEELIVVGLASNYAPITNLVFSLLKCASEGDALAVIQSNVLHALIHSLANKNSKTAVLSANLLVAIATQSTASLSAFLSQSTTAQLLSLASSDDSTIKFRSLDLISKIALSSIQNALSLCESSSLLSLFSQQIAHHDILHSLNMIELIKTFAESQQGFDFLHSSGILAQLSEILSSFSIDADQDAGLDSLLLAATIKSWGIFLFHQSTNINQIDAQYSILSSFLSIYSASSPSSSLADAIRVAVANIGSTIQGTIHLVNQSTLMSRILSDFPSSTGNIKLSILHIIACIWINTGYTTPIPPSQSRTNIESITHKILDWLPSSFVSDLISMSRKSTDMDTMTTSYHVLCGMVSHQWGIQSITQNSHLLSFLITKPASGGAAKLHREFLKIVMGNPVSCGVLGRVCIDKLEEMVKEFGGKIGSSGSTGEPIALVSTR